MLGATSQFPLGLTFLRPNKAPTSILVSATAQPRRRLEASKEEREKQSQLKGLDVLRAMQRAAAEKNKVKEKRNRKGGGLKSGQKEEEDVDYSNVRALMVKREWCLKLDELEKRLQQLTETK